ncbi:MAG: DUF6689 family protein [Candidatus Eisenbacteria bacterium]
MRLSIAVIFVLVLAVLTSAYAEDLFLVGSLPTPNHTGRLTGLEMAEGKIFAVADLPGEFSCLAMINRWTGAWTDTCFSDWIGACGDDSLNFKANAYIPSEYEGLGDHVVADECGAIVRYLWDPYYGVDTLQSFVPSTLIEDHATGLYYRGDYYYALEPDAREVHQINRYTLVTDSIISLPPRIQDGSGITRYGDNFFIVSSTTDSLYEVNMDGDVVAAYHLPGTLAYPTGVTVIGDSVYVCSQDTIIKIYVFSEEYSEDVPTGTDVEVEVVPGEAVVVFDEVTGSGTLDVQVSPAQPCPPPGGVRFLSDFYDMSTNATFEYIASVALTTVEQLPEGVKARDVRVFKRPSGLPCEPWRDVSVAPAVTFEEPKDASLRALTRMQSEDDEFSVFALAEDKRNRRHVIGLKFTYLDSAVIGNQSSIPVEAYNQMTIRITAAKYATAAFMFARAARLIDRVAVIARETPGIPHAYDPDGILENIAGQIIGRAHTLSFSLRELLKDEQVGPAPFQGKVTPDAPAEEFAPGLGSISNPSISGCTIRLTGQSSKPVNLNVYSVTGELVRTLLEGEMLTGKRSITWDGRNGHGKPVAAGTYFVVLKHGEQLTTQKVILNR